VVKHADVQALVRRTHEERVLDALRSRGPLSRSRLAEVVGLSRSTLSEITAQMLRRGAVVVVGTDAAERSGSGRPAERLALDPASGQFLGVDIGHRRVHVAVADASREVIATAEDSWPAGTGWQERLARTFELVDEMTRERGIHLGALQAVGVGVPGPYRSVPEPGSGPEAGWGRSRVTTESTRAAFGERFGTPVVVDNNVRFAALAEALHADPQTRELLYVRLGDGVGGGLVCDGRLLTGAAGLAGEVGHVRAVPGGAACRCGKRGCLETVASTSAVLDECRRRGAATWTLDDLAQLVEAGDPVVEEVLSEVGTALGSALAAAAMVLNPADVVVAGEVARAAPRVVEQAAAVAARELSSLEDAAPRVRPARLPAGAGALGALAVLVEQALQLSGDLRDDHPAPSPDPLVRRSTHVTPPPRRRPAPPVLARAVPS